MPYDEAKALYEEQKQYCEEHALPMFMNSECSCSRCGHFLFGPNGLSRETAGKRLITGCPYCHASFCD